MQTFYLSYKVMQTLLMTAVLLSLIVTLFLLLMFYDMRIDKRRWYWNIFAFSVESSGVFNWTDR